MRLPIKLALRGLRNNPNFALTAVINIGLGVMGYLVVSGFNDSFLTEVRSRTRSIAAADLVVTLRMKPEEAVLNKLRDQIPAESIEAPELSLLTMASTSTASRMVEVRFVGSHFPLYGGLKLALGGVGPAGAAHKLSGTKDVWIYPELRSQLGIALGSALKIGAVTYRVADYVDDDATTSGMGFVLAPRVYVDISTAEETGLIQFGSRVQYAYRYKLPANIDADQLEQILRKDIRDSDLKIRSHRNVTEELSKLQSYLNDYMGLVSLAALFLATVGTAYLLRGHLAASIKEFGILVSLGARSVLPAQVFAIQAASLGLIGSLLAVVISRLALPELARVMTPITGAIVIAPLSMQSLILGVTMAVGGGLCMALPLIARLTKLQPTFLFQEAAAPSVVFSWKSGFWYLPAVVMWWVAAIVQARSLRIGSIFAGACIGSTIVLSVFGIIVLRLLTKMTGQVRLWWTLRLALTQLTRNPLATLSTFLALALGATLINVIPQLRASVSREIERPDSIIPQFFMFDIQDEQISALKEFFVQQGYGLAEPSGMVRARLETINGQPANTRTLSLEDGREQEQRENLQTRMQNLSFRTHLSSAEELVEGTFSGTVWDGQGVPEISMEKDFAARLGIGLGDKLSFDISGTSIEGKVTSFRRVRWTSFQPNFFILFQPGVLDDAPKTWVASASGIPDSQKETALAQLARGWSNVSVVDVKAAVKRMLVLVDQVATAIGFVAVIALIAGLGVLFAIAGHQARERRLSFALLKTLGATISKATHVSLWEYGLIAGAAISLSAGLSFGVSWILSVYVFKAPWQGNWQTPIQTALVLLPVTMGITWIAVRRSLKVPVAELLR